MLTVPQRGPEVGTTNCERLADLRGHPRFGPTLDRALRVGVAPYGGLVRVWLPIVFGGCAEVSAEDAAAFAAGFDAETEAELNAELSLPHRNEDLVWFGHAVRSALVPPG